jgi:hypothetical protein
MNPLQRLRMKIADDILQVVDTEAPRSDIQGLADVTAKLAIARVAELIQMHDYDLEDLLR